MARESVSFGLVAQTRRKTRIRERQVLPMAGPIERGLKRSRGAPLAEPLRLGGRWPFSWNRPFDEGGGDITSEMPLGDHSCRGGPGALWAMSAPTEGAAIRPIIGSGEIS